MIFIISIVISGISIFFMYNYFENKSYSDLKNNAIKCMTNDEYDNAIEFFEQSLQHKKDDSIKSDIQKAKKLKTYKKLYNDGYKLYSGEKYLNAIDVFKKVDRDGQKWYEQSQQKISECKKLYIAQNLKSAKESDYYNADKYLNEVLKLDSKNTEAIKLKEELAQNFRQAEKDKAEYERKQIIAKNNNIPNDDINENEEMTPQQYKLENQLNELENQGNGMYKSSEEYIAILNEEEKVVEEMLRITEQLIKI